MQYSQLVSYDRNYKGFLFEVGNVNQLQYIRAYYPHGIKTLLSNPQDYDEWLKSRGGSFDCMLQIKDHWIPIEFKYISKPVHDSWIRRDWLTRTAKIIVTCKSLLRKKQIELLESNGYIVLDHSELRNHIISLIRDTNTECELSNNDTVYIMDAFEYEALSLLLKVYVEERNYLDWSLILE